MLKYKSYKLLLVFIPLLFLFGAFTFIRTTSEEWKLILEKNGVSFYTTNTESKINNILNTLVKVLNTNDYQVFIIFTPEISCKQIGEKTKKNSENTYIEPNNAYSLHIYKICEKGNAPIISLKNIVIEKR